MNPTALNSITTADALANAGDIGRCELVRGKLTMMTPAGGRHGEIAIEMGRLVANHVKEHALGRTFAAETGFLIEKNPDTVRAPDVAFVRAERLRSGVPRGFIDGPPDLAVEVVSPSDAATDVLDKAQQWLGAGASAVWVVDPGTRTVTVYEAGGGVRLLRDTDRLDAPKLLPGFGVAVAEVFDV